MKWVRGSNHNLQHDTSLKPSELPTTATATCEPRHISGYRAASLSPAATVEDHETHHMCMMKTLYEYEVDGVPRITYNTLQVRNRENLLLPL